MDILISLLINGIATGVVLFLLASGLSLIFGLMDVLNFAHGALYMWGAYVGTWLYTLTHSFSLSLIAAICTGLLLGFLLEKFTIRPLYGAHVPQILITLGVMLVLSEAVKIVFGADIVSSQVPAWLDGSWQVHQITIVKYRIFTIGVGLLVLAVVQYLLNFTRIGIYIRAGVQNREMVQALGVNIRRINSYVFAVAAALAALGGMIAGPYFGSLTPSMGNDFQMSAFIVVVIGGLGSFFGSFVGALLIGLTTSFVAYVWPEYTIAVNIVLMTIVLLIRPSGLFGQKGGRFA